MAPEFGKPIHQLPLIPANVLKKHRIHEPLDTRFRSAARLLQALWREDRDLPIGSYVGDERADLPISSLAPGGMGDFGREEIAAAPARRFGNPAAEFAALAVLGIKSVGALTLLILVRIQVPQPEILPISPRIFVFAHQALRPRHPRRAKDRPCGRRFSDRARQDAR